MLRIKILFYLLLGIASYFVFPYFNNRVTNPINLEEYPYARLVPAGLTIAGFLCLELFVWLTKKRIHIWKQDNDYDLLQLAINLSPGYISTLSNNGHPTWSGFIGTIINLARKGIIQISCEWSPGDYSPEYLLNISQWDKLHIPISITITLLPYDKTLLKPCEVSVLSTIFELNNEQLQFVRLEELKKTNLQIDKFTDIMKEELEELGYINRNWRKLTEIITVIIPTNLILGLFCWIVPLIGWGFDYIGNTNLFLLLVLLGLLFALGPMFTFIIIKILKNFNILSILNNRGYHESLKWKAFCEELRKIILYKKELSDEITIHSLIPYAIALELTFGWMERFFYQLPKGIVYRLFQQVEINPQVIWKEKKIINIGVPDWFVTSDKANASLLFTRTIYEIYYWNSAKEIYKTKIISPTRG